MISTKITLKDIADEAKVSVATVSRVINKQPGVQEEFIKAVLTASEKLGYTPPPKQDKKKVESLRIGVLCADILDEAYLALLKGIIEVTQNYSIEIVLYDSDRNSLKESECIHTMLANNIDGIIVVPNAGTLNPEIQKLVMQKYPIVIIRGVINESLSDNALMVTTDFTGGSFHATRYLLDLGHKNIVFLNWKEHNTYVPRLLGYKKAYDDIKAPIRDDLIINCDGTFEGAYSVIDKILVEKDFTAIFAASDEMAFGAWRALIDNGKKIPDDYSIIGYDNRNVSSFISLTTVAEPLQEIGKNAARVLIDYINGFQKESKSIVLRDSLIIRSSCKKI